MKSIRFPLLTVVLAIFLAVPMISIADEKPMEAPKAGTAAPAAAPADNTAPPAPAAGAPAETPKAEAPAK